MRSRRRLAARIALAVLACAIALEVALQSLAFVMAYSVAERGVEPHRPPGDSRVVLCIGDSFTFGMGASRAEAAYPAVLGARLRERDGGTWHSINGGRAGEDSKTFAESFDALLETHRPEFVCILVGVNDAWRRRGRAAQTDTGAARAGFEWRWRSPDLLRLLLHGRELFRHRPDPAEEPVSTIPADHPLIGLWTIEATGSRALFARDGICDLGNARLPWSVDVHGIRLGHGQTAVSLALTIDGELATLSAPGRDPMVLGRVRGATAADLDRHATLARLLVAHTESRHGVVVALGKQLLGGAPLTRADAFQVLPALALAAQLAGERELAARAVGILQRCHAELPDAASRAALAESLSNSVRDPEVLVLLDGPDRSPLGPSELVALALASVRCKPQRDAIATIDRLLAEPTMDGPTRASLHAARFRALPRSERDALVQELVRGWRAAPQSAEIAQLWRLEAMRAVDEPLLRSLAVHEGLPPDSVERLLAARRDALAGDSDWRADLAANLELMIATCRDRGVRPVLGTYPFEDPELHAVVLEVARRHALPVAATAGRFPTDPAQRAACFVADGHCNDAGYALMAEAFADAVLREAGR